MIQVEGLGHEVVGPVVHGLHRSLDSAVACEDYDRDVLVVCSYLLKEFLPCHLGHLKIGDDQVHLFGGNYLQGLKAVACLINIIAFVHKTHGKAPADIDFIICYKDIELHFVSHSICFISFSMRGSVMRNVVPEPCREVTPISPPIPRIIL